MMVFLQFKCIAQLHSGYRGAKYKQRTATIWTVIRYIFALLTRCNKHALWAKQLTSDLHNPQIQFISIPIKQNHTNTII